ncbi:Radial spokehead-like protein [Cinara cedri]|uniref:Radial spokehead-like protein n=1 Tax=Cinara cedri TaxID=506608 RepID=A0A5E4NIG2_9HEMI|nr:Radial spokehead-like protein [Cinara cedri]
MSKKNHLLKISSDPGWKMLSDVKTSSTVNHKIKSSIKTQSRKMSVSSELANYLKIKEDNGNISLYTHIQALLDLFIFQNPLRPIEYFEYYSEQLKQYYQRPRRNPDLDFLNNIELNVCNKLTDIYKDTGGEKKEDTTNNFLEYKEELQYEVENEYEENVVKKTNEFDRIVIQDLSKINYLFNKVGCGITNDEAYLIGITINQMSNQDKFKNIRYWGKIFGLKHNYYVLECELQKKELEYKLMILNSLLKNNINNFMDVYENVYEHEEGSMMGIYEQDEEMSKIKLSASRTTSNSMVNESSFVKSGFQDSNLCIPSFAEESDVDDYEMYGFGTNKKSYFVTNQLFDEWVELPLLKPHHIIQSRNINQYFVGDLDAPVKSYPLFRGLEKHYLRAQIARITAVTQISPRDYFIIDHQHRKSNNWTGLSSFQAKVLSQKWNHDYIENINYQPLSVYALLNPTNWVHHTPLITEEGVTRAWAKLRKSQNDYETVKEYVNEETYEMTASIDSVTEVPDPLIPLSEDVYADKVPPWKFETINQFDGTATHASVKSILWPGAFAVACESLVDYTYCGWGQKWQANGFRTPVVLCDEFQAELLVNPATMTEAKDPTYEDEQLFYSKIQQLQEELKKKRKAITHLTVYDVNEEDEERVLTSHDYD